MPQPARSAAQRPGELPRPPPAGPACLAGAVLRGPGQRQAHRRRDRQDRQRALSLDEAAPPGALRVHQPVAGRTGADMTSPEDALPHADEELWTLVEALIEGSATPGQRDRLEARLEAEGPARQFYVAYLDLHAQLQWRTRGESARPDTTVARPDTTVARPSGSRRIRSPWGGVLAGAGALALGIGLSLLLLRPRNE